MDENIHKFYRIIKATDRELNICAPQKSILSYGKAALLPSVRAKKK